MRRWLPELATVLRNSVKTGHTFVEKEAKVQALFDDVAGFSSTSKDFLEQNGSNIIRLSKQGQAQLPLFAKYAPEYPCLLKGMVNWAPRHGAGLPELHPAHQPRGAPEPADRLHDRPTAPRYGAHNGPHCERLPNPPYRQENRTPQPPIPAVDDGVERRPRQVPPARRDRRSTCPPATPAPPPSGRSSTRSPRPRWESPNDDVPDLASLLLGPLARGTEVSVR